MGILFIITFCTCLFCLLGIIKREYDIMLTPDWFLYSLLCEVLFFIVYITVQNYIVLSHEIATRLLFVLHDIILIAVILIIVNTKKYLFPCICALYYVIFCGIIIKKRMREEKIDTESKVVRTELPRKYIDDE